MNVNRKAVLAVALGVSWIGLAVWQWSVLPEPVHVPLANVSGPASASKTGKPGAGRLQVNLGLLDTAKAQRDVAFTAPRNIFSAPRLDGKTQNGQENGSLPVLNPKLDQALQQQAAEAEMLQYRYLGFLRMADSRKRPAQVAILSKNEEVVAVKVGDRFDQRLVLKALTPDSVTIRDLDTRLEHTVLLSEEATSQP